ncbi:hypothetical protein [Candidatus Nitrospira bockiana]
MAHLILRGLLVFSLMMVGSGGLATAAPVVFSDAGVDRPAIQDTVDAFRGAIGGMNNGNAPGPLATGRREINWDGGGAAAPVLTNMPHDLFKGNRGALFEPDSTVFSISGQPAPEFGNINPTYPGSFTTFSSPRLFSPTNSVVTDQVFFVPGTNLRATVQAFGVVFTDVDVPNTTGIEYFSLNGGSLGKFFAPTANNGLSFVGVSFTGGELISRVAITTGNTILGPTEGGGIEVVAMDDFIYSEPQTVIPEPTSVLLVASGLPGLWLARRIALRSRDRA